MERETRETVETLKAILATIDEGIRMKRPGGWTALIRTRWSDAMCWRCFRRWIRDRRRCFG